MFLECTKKLADTLKIKIPDITVIHRQPLYEWHANLFTFNRRKGVIFMNNQTRYCVVLYGIRKEHFRQFDDTILSAIKETFLAEGFSADVVARYIKNCGEVVLTKTHDRSVLSQMNDMLFLTSNWIEDCLPANDLCLVDLNKKLGEVPVGSLKYAFPIERLRDALK